MKDPQLLSGAQFPEFALIYDEEWVREAHRAAFVDAPDPPDAIHLRHLVYHPGSRVVAGYVAERRWEDWVAEEQFAVEISAGAERRVFAYPDDPYLPGLRPVASAVEAQELLPRYVPLHPHRLLVETVRYRPTSRAVVRQTARLRRSFGGDVVLFARVMQPRRAGRYLDAGELAGCSGFMLPRLAGWWPEGGVAWLARIPGETVARKIRRGQGPDPEAILDGLALLWSAPSAGQTARMGGKATDLAAAFRWTQQALAALLHEDTARRLSDGVAAVLALFAESWRPSGPAHNDFYDDQLIQGPDGRIALVDFEETGPGDPLLDVGNFLAHLRWGERFGRAAPQCRAYAEALRDAALTRFRWEPRALALREAFSLFRLTLTPVHRLQTDWPEAVTAALSLVAETLEVDS